MRAEPSPAPWRIVKRASINGAAIVAADGVRVATISHKADKSLWQKEADAEAIREAPTNAKIADVARDLVALWLEQKIGGASRAERNAAIEHVRARLIEAVTAPRPITGFLATLSPDHLAATLANTVEDSLGGDEFRLSAQPLDIR